MVPSLPKLSSASWLYLSARRCDFWRGSTRFAGSPVSCRVRRAIVSCTLPRKKDSMGWKAARNIAIGGAAIGLLGYTMGPVDTVQATHTAVGATVWGTAVGVGAIKDEAPAAWRGGLNAGSGKPMFGPEPDVKAEADDAAEKEAAKVRKELKQLKAKYKKEQEKNNKADRENADKKKEQ